MPADTRPDLPFGPFLRSATGANEPVHDPSLPGELWHVDRKLGSGCFWHYLIDGTMAVSIIEAEYQRDVALALGAPDSLCFGKHCTDAHLFGFTWEHAASCKTVPSGRRLRIASITLLPEAVAHLESNLACDPGILATAIAGLGEGQRPPGIDELFDGIYSVRPGKASAAVFYESKVAEASALLADWHLRKLSPAAASIRPVDQRALNTTLDYIERHLDEPLRLETLCRISCMSASKLGGLFRQAKGRTPMEYVREQRMERACRMLGRSDIPLGEMASKLGFSHQSSFSKAFKATYGIPPLAYRKSHPSPYPLPEDDASPNASVEALEEDNRTSKERNHHVRAC